MKILIGSLQHETNTFSPVKTQIKDFEFAKGEDIFNHLSIKEVFENANAELVPTIYANALPSGKITLEAYRYFKDKILNVLDNNCNIDGVWLYLHGAMEVEEIGSGDGDLVSTIREKIGSNVPIAVALDFHANISDKLINSANIICGYRTAPHIDQQATQIRAAKLLIKSIKEKILPKPVIVRPPLILTGDMVTSTIDPMRSLIKELEKIEANEEILSASIFNGQPWVDAPNAMASVVVIAKSNIENAHKEARKLAKKFWDSRYEFHFEEEAMEPEEAVEQALKGKEKLIFISDSGDNTTAGAPGDNTMLLKLFMDREKISKKVLIAGITDSKAVRLCKNYQLGESLIFNIGAELDKTSEKISFEGTIKNKGRILGWAKEDAGGTVVININHKNIDVIITENRSAFICPESFEKAGVDIFNYDVVVVKLGYLFTELKAISNRSILALTPGASCEDISKLRFSKIVRPIFPIDNDFEWS